MFNFLLTVVLFHFACISGKNQRLIQGDHGLKRSNFQHGVSYAKFVAHKFQYLQGSLLDSSCEIVRPTECAFACVANAPCVSFNVALSPNENGTLRCELLREDKFRSPDKLTDSQQFHHYSIKVSDNFTSCLRWSDTGFSGPYLVFSVCVLSTFPHSNIIRHTWLTFQKNLSSRF